MCDWIHQGVQVVDDGVTGDRLDLAVGGDAVGFLGLGALAVLVLAFVGDLVQVRPFGEPRRIVGFKITHRSHIAPDAPGLVGTFPAFEKRLVGHVGQYGVIYTVNVSWDFRGLDI